MVLSEFTEVEVTLKTNCARRLSFSFSFSLSVRLFAHPLPHPHSPLHSAPLTVLCLLAGRVVGDGGGGAAAAQSVCLTHVRWKSINILQ